MLNSFSKVISFAWVLVLVFSINLIAKVAQAKDQKIVPQSKVLMFGKQGVKLKIPRDFCYLNEKNPFDAVMIGLIKKAAEPRNRLKAVYADCEVLKAVSTGKKNDLYPMGYIAQSARINGRKLAEKQSMMVLNKVCNMMVATMKKNMGNIQKLQQNQLDKALKENKELGDIKINQLKILDLYKKGSKYCTTGQIQNLTRENKKSKIITLISIVIKDGQLFNIYLSNSLSSDKTITNLKSKMKQILTLNNIQ